MSESLTPVRFEGGVYEGLLHASEPVEIEAVHHGKVVAVAMPKAEGDATGTFTLRLSLPASVLSDGLQTIALRSTESGEVLDRVSVLAGTALEEDPRAEIALLRDELELLKRAFRRHVGDQES